MGIVAIVARRNARWRAAALAALGAAAGSFSLSTLPGSAARAQGADPDKVDSENLFGFTEGSDTGSKGEKEVILDTIGRFSKRRDGPGRSGYAAVQPLLSYQYDPTDSFTIEPGLFFDARDSRNIAGVPDKSYGTFNGGSLEMKYQFHKRTDASPFGLAIQAEPFFERVLPVEGRGADIFSLDTRLIADVRLIPDRLWLGANLVYDPSVGRQRGSREVDRSSTLSLSGALMARVSDTLFIGPEMRYLRAYDGAFLNRFEGHAVFLGPVLHHQVSEKGFVSVAYSAQVFGHDRDPDYTDRALDLAHFPRHSVRVRFGVNF
ncbi:hypothetical protein OPKNFCMD_5890 [Methylobacterium crusticola]|uniref:Autotransporter outer membrane beta-barrel domain-containing protein n=1 Tax=Methylobacterium crusticola TaxID=1697972 RepID=A0ABQ4R8J3_9HYPH|nr:hypothetical protein [Methylobacterium crusticola]GJD53119.1 hypothetical protein OPKNFCMD_5890 [Methylobacterium crusticola]